MSWREKLHTLFSSQAHSDEPVQQAAPAQETFGGQLRSQINDTASQDPEKAKLWQGLEDMRSKRAQLVENKKRQRPNPVKELVNEIDTITDTLQDKCRAMAAIGQTTTKTDRTPPLWHKRDEFYKNGGVFKKDAFEETCRITDICYKNNTLFITDDKVKAALGRLYDEAKRLDVCIKSDSRSNLEEATMETYKPCKGVQVMQLSSGAPEEMDGCKIYQTNFILNLHLDQSSEKSDRDYFMRGLSSYEKECNIHIDFWLEEHREEAFAYHEKELDEKWQEVIVSRGMNKEAESTPYSAPHSEL
jgi:hypothetical protein